MEAEGKTLEAAVVISRKPLIRQEDDKTIIDPENLAEASTNGYEVIEKTPGLFVDQDGNIYISSLTPATVQINGRDLRMSAADVATMLKSLPPNAISKIEIVRTPSAKYDAAGSGGVVNVVLKKGIKIGMTGSINAGMQQGTYGNRFAGFNLNNNDGTKSYYINMNYNRRNNYENVITNRLFAADSMLSQDAFTKYTTDSYFAGYGINFFKSKKWDFEFSGNINLNNSDNYTDNLNVIKKISASQIIASSPNIVFNKGTSLVIGNGIETKLKIDTLGSEWSNNVFYYNSHNTSEQYYSTFSQSNPSISKKGDGSGDNKRHFFSAKSDLRLKLKRRITIETGIKSTVHNYKNKTDYFLESGGGRVQDTSRTNIYDYKENINSLYLQASKTFWKDFVIKSGARLENTNMVGDQIVPYDTSFTLRRTDLFPYVYLSKNLMKIAGFDLKAYLVYRRTISRPVYEQLNPFPKYIDEFLTEIGNPSLQPQFTKNFEANISVDERPILAVGLNDTKDIFSMVTYQSDTGRKQALRTYDNLGKTKNGISGGWGQYHLA
ncbi:MAG: TonB-dependent receptor [Chitinophagaceae bacterium]|nr:TonB-dependent receptor [Chitinophagaceae bacterium]